MAMSVVDSNPLRRAQTRAEILADSCVHAFGVVAAIGGSAILVVSASAEGGVGKISSVVVYALGLLAMFTASAAYNLCYATSWRGVLRRCDHAAIFLMIAGTYTPFTTQLHVGASAALITVAIWATSLAGVLLKFRAPELFERIPVWLYLGLGWASVAVLAPLVERLSLHVFAAVVLGGSLYTIGVAFHCWERLKYQNAIWHVFVLSAAAVHYVAILRGVVLTGV